MSFKEVIKRVRIKSKMTQVEFAEILGVHHKMISQYETGYKVRPAMWVAKSLVNVAKRFKIKLSLDEIY